MKRLSLSAAISTTLVVLILAVGCGGEAVVDQVADLEEACDADSCPDGYCSDAGVCVTRAQICARACEIIPGCMTSTPTECYDFCFEDLGDCSAQQMAATDACTDEIIPTCNTSTAEAWLMCVTAISCLES